MSGQASEPLAATQLTEIQATLKQEGFGSVGDLVKAYNEACGARDKNAEARDKFNEANDEARKIIGSKGGEISVLKQRITELEQENKDLKESKQTSTPPAEAGQTVPPTPAQPSTDEELESVEASLTDAQRKAADELLEQMTDEEAVRITKNKEIRLEFLKGLKADPELQSVERPGSFWDTKEPEKEEATASDIYQQVASRMRRSPKGPSSASGVVRTGVKSSGKPQEVSWLH